MVRGFGTLGSGGFSKVINMYIDEEGLVTLY